MKTPLKITFIVLCLGFVSIAMPRAILHAQTPDKYTVLAPLPCIPSAPNPDVPGDKGVVCPGGDKIQNQGQVDFKTYIQYAFNLLIAVAAVTAVFMIVKGGIVYMTTSSFTNKKASLDSVTHAVYGLILILASYLILRTVDPRFVAIPNGLVPTLKLKCPGQPNLLASDPACNANQTNDLLTNLQNEADNYHVAAQQNTALAQQIQAQITSTQLQIKSLQDQISSLKKQNVPDSDPRIQDLKAQIDEKTKSIALSQNDIEVTKAYRDMSTAVSDSLNLMKSTGADAAGLSSIMGSTITTLKADAAGRIKVLQGFAATNHIDVTQQIDAINDREQYNEAFVKMQAASTMYSTAASNTVESQKLSSSIDTIVANYKDSIKNPSVQQQLTTTAAQIKSAYAGKN